MQQYGSGQGAAGKTYADNVLTTWRIVKLIPLIRITLKLIVGRLTITLDDSIHQALKEAAARQGRSMGKIIEEGLVLRGIKPTASARQLVARARLNVDGLNDDEAIKIAVTEALAVRKA